MSLTLKDKNSNSSLLLQSVHVEVDVVDDCVEFMFKQSYFNDRDVPIEASYSLDLPKSVNISGLLVISEGRRIKAVVKELEEAFNTYSDAIASGNSAFLIEKSETPEKNLFKIEIGNLPPKKAVQVEITLLTTLQTIGTGKQFCRIPLELLPKTGDLSINCGLSMSYVVKKIEATNGSIISSDQKKVEWTKRNASELQTDFTVTIYSEKLESSAIVEIDIDNPKHLAVMLTLYPKLDTPVNLVDPKYEFIFVVDRSGSMAGFSMDCTKKALNILLHAIPPDSKFNIIGFGTSTDYLFPESVLYTEENLLKAKQKCDKLQADLGGTDLLKPLKGIFSSKIDPVFPRLIFVLTDGAVDDRNGTIAEIKKSIETGHLYALGIGSGVDKTLVQGMAEAGRGSHIFVDANKIDEAVMSLFRGALVPLFTNIEIPWPKNTLQSPNIIPTAESDQRTVVYALIDDGIIEDFITVKSKLPDKQMFWKVPAIHRKGNIIQKFVASSIIRDLQEGRHPQEPADKIKQKIIQLGITFQLATKHTSFVAVEELQEASEGTLQNVQLDTKAPEKITVSRVDQDSKKNTYSEKKMKKEKQKDKDHVKQEEKMKEKQKDKVHVKQEEKMKEKQKDPMMVPTHSEKKMRKKTQKDHVKEEEKRTVRARKLEIIDKNEDAVKSKKKESLPPKVKSQSRSSTIDAVAPAPAASSSSMNLASASIEQSAFCLDLDNDEDKSDYDEEPASYSILPNCEPEFLMKKSELDQESYADVLREDIEEEEVRMSKNKNQAKKSSISKKEKKEKEAISVSPPPEHKVIITKTYDYFVGKQNFNGSWDFTSITGGTNLSDKDFISGKPPDCSSDVLWSTALCIALLEVKFASSKSVWNMVAKKAQNFIEKELRNTGISPEAAKDLALKFVEYATTFWNSK